MSELLQLYKELIGLLGSGNAPATPADFAAYARKVGYEVPADIQELYKIADGFDSGQRFDFISLTDSAKYGAFFDGLQLFPFTDENDSNPYCMSALPALKEYVFHIFHDDDSGVAYRSLNSFIHSIIDAVNNEEDLIPEIINDATPRSASDQVAGRALVAQWLPDVNGDEFARPLALHIAAELLDERDITLINELLFDSDLYVRESGTERLKGIGSPAAKACLFKQEQEKLKFRARAISALKEANITVVENAQNPEVLRLDPGPIHLDLNVFFCDRNAPDAMEQLVARARKFLDQRGAR